MGIRVALHHRTRYQYDREVSLSPQVVRLRPAPHCRTPIVSYSLRITPSQHFLNWQQDPQGNFLARVVFPEKTRELALEVDLVAEMTVINPFDFFLEPEVIEFPFRYSDWLAGELTALSRHRAGRPRSWRAVWRRLPHDAKRTVDYLVDMNRFVHEQIRYVTRQEPGVQSLRRDVEFAERLVPRLGLAARPDPAKPGIGRAVCVGLSDSTAAGREAARRAGWNRPRLHRPPRLDRGLSARCRLGRARSDIGVAHGRRAPAVGGQSRFRIGGPADRLRSTRAKPNSTSICRSRGSMKIRASRAPTARSSGANSDRGPTRRQGTDRR